MRMAAARSLAELHLCAYYSDAGRYAAHWIVPNLIGKRASERPSDPADRAATLMSAKSPTRTTKITTGPKIPALGFDFRFGFTEAAIDRTDQRTSAKRVHSKRSIILHCARLQREYLSRSLLG